MPFLKEFIINEKTKIKLWKVVIGELNTKELNSDEKKEKFAREKFLMRKENEDVFIIREKKDD